MFVSMSMIFFSMHETAYEIRCIDGSSDVCSSDLRSRGALVRIGQCGLAASLLCLSSPAHAEPGPELIEAAEGEGELTAYIALANEVAQAWFEDFSEKYGIEVQTYRASTATVSRRILTEKEAGATSADVAILTEIPTWENLISEGIVEDYTPTRTER